MSDCTTITFTNLDNSIAFSSGNVSNFKKVKISPGLLIDSKLNSTIPDLIMTEMKSYIFLSNYLALGVITHEECVNPFSYIHFLLNNMKYHELKWHFILLTHFWPIFSFYIPWKHQEMRDFLVFSGSIKWEDRVVAIVNISLYFNPCQFSILYLLKTQWNQRFSGSTKWKHWPETG